LHARRDVSGEKGRLLIGRDPAEAVGLAAECLAEALTGRQGRRSVALAGGSTPAVLYRHLTEPAWRERIAWDRVDWFWGDERAVPPEHADSNYRMACETLLAPLGIASDHIHRMPADSDDLSAAAAAYERKIREVVSAGREGVPSLDLVLLGVGTDGHTASLFPGTSGVTEACRLIVAHEVPKLGAWRMTMTFPLLRAARRVVFFVTGADKAEIVARILSPAADPGILPAAGLRQSGAVVWVLDAAAASRLSR